MTKNYWILRRVAYFPLTKKDNGFRLGLKKINRRIVSFNVPCGKTDLAVKGTITVKIPKPIKALNLDRIKRARYYHHYCMGKLINGLLQKMTLKEIANLCQLSPQLLAMRRNFYRMVIARGEEQKIKKYYATN